ncbi:MAG: hypothetical protein M3P49_14420, partial [Actinomycetota bacterium]|nr:hypothetical protein [Actinomycetota bacterium]
ADECVDPLLTRVQRMVDDLERLWPQWAPVLIQDADLIRLANQIPELIFASRRLRGTLEAAEATAFRGKTHADWITEDGFDLADHLVEEFRDYDRLASRFQYDYITYRDGRPPRQWATMDDDYPESKSALSPPVRKGGGGPNPDNAHRGAGN